MQMYFYPVARVELMHLGALTVHSRHQGPIVGKYNSSWRRRLKGCSWGDRKNLQKVIWLVLNCQMLSDKKREPNLPIANKLTARFLLTPASNHEDCNSPGGKEREYNKILFSRAYRFRVLVFGLKIFSRWGQSTTNSKQEGKRETRKKDSVQHQTQEMHHTSN